MGPVNPERTETESQDFYFILYFILLDWLTWTLSTGLNAAAVTTDEINGQTFEW